MKHSTQIIVIAFLSLFLLTGCNATKSGKGSAQLNAPDSMTLSGSEVMDLVSGNTFDWSHTIRQLGGKFYFAADGTMKASSSDGSRSGVWEVVGNQLCFTGVKGRICRTIEKGIPGKEYFLVKNGDKRVVKLKNIQKGDAI